jgi:hypothetical protein
MGTTRNVAQAIAARQSAEAALHEALDAGRRREAEAALRVCRDLVRATDVAWDGIALVMAAAQTWIGAAAVEAAEAGLIKDRADVLLLELEELKQVATGEWHGGKRDAVQEQVERRRSHLLGAPEPVPQATPRPAGGGPVDGAVLRVDSWDSVAPQSQRSVVTRNPDAGWTDHWFTAAGLTSAVADTCSPRMLAARVLGLPSIIGAAEFVGQGEAGDTTHMDGNTAQIIAPS